MYKNKIKKITKLKYKNKFKKYLKSKYKGSSNYNGTKIIFIKKNKNNTIKNNTIKNNTIKNNTIKNNTIKNNTIKNNTNSLKYFITFGGGGQNYIDATNRINNQAQNTNLFDKTIIYTDKYLENDKKFWNIHSIFIKNNKRGYGYWLWKPYIILKTMNTMKNGDILLYADAGCEIDYRNTNKMNILKKYFKLVKKYKIIFSYTGQKEYKYNKMDLIKKLNMTDDKYSYTQQRQSTVLLFLICNKTRNFVNEWYKIACNYHLIDDSPSINKNIDGFIEHRHDQSIFSLLSKKYKFNSYITIEKAINMSRNKTGITRFAYV
jgi:hypothetical protein